MADLATVSAQVVRTFLEKNLTLGTAESLTGGMIAASVAGVDKIFKAGGATKYADVPYVSRLCASNKADRKSADAIWEEMIAKVNDEYENKWLANIK